MNSKKLIKSTGIVAISTLSSRILGFVRDVIIANVFGASRELGGFFIAFRIPNLFRRLVAEGSLTISFIPVYTEYLENKGKDEALKLAQKTLSILIIVLLCIVSIGIIFSPYIVNIFAYGFDDIEIINFTVYMNRLLFPYLFLVGIVAFSMGYLNSNRVFFAPAFSPVLLNVGFIIGALLFTKFFEKPLIGLVCGVLFGGILQLLLQIPYMIKHGFKMKISIDFKHPGIRRIFKMIAPAVFGIAVYQLNILINTAYASTCEEGSIPYLYYCDRLTELILGIFIVSIGNVILPEMSRFAASKDYKALKEMYRKAVLVSLFLAVPASAALIIIGYPLLNVMFVRGSFTNVDALNTFKALKYAALAVPSLAVLRISTPTFYSMEDTKTPVYSAVAALIVNIVCGYYLKNTILSYAGLSLSISIAAFVQVTILVIFLHKKIGNFGFRKIFSELLKIVVATIVMSLVIFYLKNMVDWDGGKFISKILSLLLIIFTGGGAFFIVCWIVNLEEFKFLINTFFKRLKH